MPHPDDICVRLFSELFPCPWIDTIPHLKHASERLQDDIDSLESPLSEYLQETIELCQGCRHYEAVAAYRRDGLMHWKLCRGELHLVPKYTDLIRNFQTQSQEDFTLGI